MWKCRAWTSILARAKNAYCLQMFKRGENKSVAEKTAPWWIPKRYRENEHREYMPIVEAGHLKKYTEAMLYAVQEQALRVNSIKHNTDDQNVSLMCRLCGKLSGTLMHLSSGFPVLAKSKYQIRHDRVSKHIHWLF